jgi:putative oligomerization/nucleic acid binding protein/phospholipase D-like protein
VILGNYTFASFLWDVLVIFAFVIWFWLLIGVFGDIFRRRDIGGWGKAAWIILVIVLPYFGVFIYLIAEHSGMAERNAQQLQAQQAVTDQYIRSVSESGGPASEIQTAKNLLDSGAITQAEYDALKAKALAQG